MLAEPELLGAQSARVQVIPDGEEHPRWCEVVEFVAALGVELDPWQWTVLHSALLRRGDVWAAFAVAVCAPRQNGKNGILEIRELAGACLLGEKLVIHSAHLADTSKEGFRKLEDLIEANDWLSRDVKHMWRTNGHEAIEFRNGCRIRFRTRTRGGGRGFSGSPIAFDEAMYLPEVSMGAMMPVLTAQPDPQVWYMGSAVDQLVQDDGVVFARVRERAIQGTDDRLAYFEWSLDAESPDEVDDDVALDPEVWAATNPAFGIRVSAGYIEAEIKELGSRTFAVERLGVGDWPATDGSANSVISLDLWDGLADQESQVLDPVVFAFDVSPERDKGAVGAAGMRADDLWHVEVTEMRAGTGWMVAYLAGLQDRHQPLAIVTDGKGPAGSLLHDLEQAGVTVELVTAEEHARACGDLFDLVEQSGLRHIGQRELRAAIKGSDRRPLGDAWAWSRRRSSVNISPLVAVTLALYGARTKSGGGGVCY